MTKEKFIRHVLSVTDEGWASLDAGMAYDALTYNNVLLCAESAMRWLAVNAPDDMLSGSDEVGEAGMVVSGGLTETGGAITLPTDYIRLIRIKRGSWKKSLGQKDVIEESSDDYMMRQYDPQMGTEDHPYVVQVNGAVRKLIAMPQGNGLEIDYVSVPDLNTSGSSFPIPPKLKNALIYYTAYLILVGYGDTKAQSVLSVVYSELGITPQKK